MAREKQARLASPPYRRIHPTVTVYDFLQLKGNYQAQRQVDKEVAEMELGTRRWDAEAKGWQVLVGGEWCPAG